MDTDNWKIGEKLTLKSLRNLDHLKDFNKLKPILYDLYYFTDYLLPVTTNTCHYFVGRYVWPFTVDSKTIHVMKEALLCIPIKDKGTTELASFFKKFSSGTLGSDVVITKVFMDYVSPSFKYLPYMISESENIFFFNVHDNVVLYDEVPNDYTNFQWYFDSGFYYIDWKKDRIYYHHINEGDSDDSTSEEDIYIYETTRIIKNIHISNNFGHLVIITEDENKCTTIECIFINNNYKICRIVEKSTYDYEYVGNNLIETNPEFYFKTNNGALNYKIISVSVVNINKMIISDTIEENDNKLLDCSYFNGNFLLYYSTNELLLVNENIKKLPLIHQNGHVTLCKSQYNKINCTTDVFYKYERATYPYVIYHHDLNTELTKSLKPSFSNIISKISSLKSVKLCSNKDFIYSSLILYTKLIFLDYFLKFKFTFDFIILCINVYLMNI